MKTPTMLQMRKMLLVWVWGVGDMVEREMGLEILWMGEDRAMVGLKNMIYNIRRGVKLLIPRIFNTGLHLRKP